MDIEWRKKKTLRLCLDDQRKSKERKSKERLNEKRIESEGIVLVVWYKRKWNRKLKERKIHIY